MQYNVTVINKILSEKLKTSACVWHTHGIAFTCDWFKNNITCWAHYRCENHNYMKKFKFKVLSFHHRYLK